MNQPPRPDDGSDAYARDHLGRILRDRFGNPVPRRSGGRPDGSSGAAPESADRPRGRHERSSDSSAPDNSTRFLGDAQDAGPRGSRGDRGYHRDRSPRRSQDPQGSRGTQPASPNYRRSGAAGATGASGAQEPYRDRYPQQPPRPERDRSARPAGYRSRPERPGRNAGRDAGQGTGLRPVGAGRRARRRSGRRLGLKKTLGLIVAVLVVLGLGTAWWVDSSLNRIDALAGYDGRPGNTKGTNWLLVGSDSREGLTEEQGEEYAAGDLSEGGQRTDTIIVVHIPRFGGKPTMVSIPRDSYVSIPGYGEDKINAAFSYGGPQLLQQTIEQNTGMRIDHYMELGFGGFAGIVDAVGGVTLCPKEAIDDPMAGLNVEAGCQKMDGPTALGYVRTRYTSANGDLDRVERQREFLTAVIKKVGSLSTMVNPFRAFPLIRSLTKAVTVDDHDHVQHLASLGFGLLRGSDQETVPVSGFADTDAGSVVLWDDGAAENLFRKMR